MVTKHILLSCSLAVVGGTLAPASRAQELQLADGRVLVGAVTERGATLEVATRDGIVVVPRHDVIRLVPAEELRRQLAATARTAGDTAFAHLNLAARALDHGLEPELWRHLDAAVVRLGEERQRLAGEPHPVERRLRDFLPQIEPYLLPRSARSARTAARVHQLLEKVRSDTSPGRLAAIDELLVREANADPELRAAARSSAAPAKRIAALNALQRRATAGNDRFVLRTAILDGAAEVRQAAVALARPVVSADDVAYLAAGLAHDQGQIRIRTAEALGGLGHPAAVPLLVRAGPHAGAGLAGDSSRAHVAFLQQQAYVRDFDVEIAAAAFIADPRVGVLQSGAVLDVNVAGVVEVRTIVLAYRRALRQLTAADPGGDPGRWPRWLAELPGETGAPHTGQR